MKKQFIQFLKNRTKKTFRAATTASLLFFCTHKLSSQAGAALNFDGANDYVNLGSSITTSLSNAQVLTAEAWVRPAASVTANVVSNHFGGTQFALRQVGNFWNFFIGFGAYNVNTAVGTASLNTWQHLAGVFNGTMVSIYLNGALASTISVPANYSLAANSNSVWIGNNGFSEIFNGNIDEVRIWKRALCASEIQNNMNGELSNGQLGLLAYYKFNQGIAAASNPTVTTLIDASISNVTGTLTNFALTGATSNWITPGGVVSGSLASVFTGTAITVNSGSISPGQVFTMTPSGGVNYTYTSGSSTVSPVVSTQYTVYGYDFAGGCLNKAVSTVSLAGASFNFDGTNDYINLGSNITTSLSNAQVLTAEAWVRPAASVTANVVSNHFGGTQFALRQVGNLWNFFIGFGAYGVNTAAGTASVNTWQHLAGVYNGTMVSLYLNGVLASTISVPANYSLAANSNSVWIGNNGFSELFNGDIDEVRIWKRALCQSEIQNNKNGELGMPQNSLLAYYKFNQGTSALANPTQSTLIDAAGVTTGTVMNAALNGTVSNWNSPGGVITGSTAPVFTVAPFAVSGSNSVCVGSSATYTASGALTYSWNGGVTTATIAVSPTVNTTYYVIGTFSTGCAAMIANNMTVNPNPTVMVTGSSNTICTGETATLTAGGAASYSWNTGANTSVTAVSPTVNTNYTVAGTSSLGCSGTGTFALTVDLCTGVKQANSADASINIYPNPSTGNFIIETEKAVTYVIYDVIGTQVQQGSMEAGKHRIDFSSKPNGVYFLSTESNRGVKVIKLIKN